jgi:hypothetical protein
MKIALITALMLIAIPIHAQIMWPSECDDSLDARRIIDHRVWTCRDSKLVPLASTITGPYINVKLTNHDQTWYEPLIVPHRTTDRAYWTSTLLSLALTVADVENSRYALAKPGTMEANSIFGHHPGRATYYGITLPIFMVNAIVSYRYKREDDALAYAGIPGHRYSKWWLPNAINTFGHAAGTLVTLASTGR